MKVRIKFKKYGAMRFVGHLDLMRFFQKLFRRADIPVALTKGYSPHMIMSFASPLGIGAATEGDYLDVELTAGVNTEEAIERMNRHSVEGVEIVEMIRISDDKKMTAMTILEAASYTCFIRDGHHSSVSPLQLREAAECFLNSQSILIEKKTKRSVVQKDIRPLVYELSVLENGALYVLCASGSRENIKPDLIAQALGNGYARDDWQAYGVTRIDMYARENERLIPMSEMGEPRCE